MPGRPATLDDFGEEITQETRWANCPDCDAFCQIEAGLFLDGSEAVVCVAPSDVPGLLKWCARHNRRYPTPREEDEEDSADLP